MVRTWSTCVLLLAAAGTLGAPPGATAQPVAGATGRVLTLAEAFESAWERQPDARAAAARRQAAQAGKAAAEALSPEPAAFEVEARPGREYQAVVTLPLWLPGERTRSARLADAQLEAVELRQRAARSRLAGAVRDAWWALQRAQGDAEAARHHLASAGQLAADVSRRVRAGDLARADQHQADSALAQAESALAQAESEREAALASLRAFLAGPLALLAPDPEPLPGGEAGPQQHPAVAEARQRSLLARRTLALAELQTRANPQLALGAAREQGDGGEAARQSLVVGIRVPFGGGARTDARMAAAQADVVDAEAAAELEQERVSRSVEAARVRLAAAQRQVAAAERRAQLASETRGFFDKSFRLGETDLPNRLRVEHEAAEAQRALARSRLEAAAAVSQLRQAMGLLFD